jgi:hypothetical protein
VGTVNGAVALPVEPVLVTVAEPALARPGTFDRKVIRPLSSATAEPRRTLDAPDCANTLATWSPSPKNCPVILNGAPALPEFGVSEIEGTS